MIKKDCVIRFVDSDYPPIILENNQKLSEYLTVENSPLLFGCRTGICGTCLVVIHGDVPLPSDEEKEILDIFVPGNKNARLACQIELIGDIEIAICAEEK